MKKIRLHRPRSCLGWFLWALGALVIFVLLYNIYAQVQIFFARMQAEGLAKELDYTPANLLSEWLDHSNINIMTASYLCSSELLFITPLELPEFEERLLQAVPRGLRIDPFPYTSTEIYSDLPLTVTGADGAKITSREALPPITVFWWSLRAKFPTEGGTVYLGQTKSAASTFKYGERLIDGNIAIIQWPAGRFPFWVLWC